MPKRKQALNARIQNLQSNKSRKVRDQEMNSSTTILDTVCPTSPSSEGLEGYHNRNRDTCDESPEPEHFHLNLQSTQTDTKEAGKCARTLHHTGNSERTRRRRRKALKDLQAKGFQTLPDFFRKKAEKAKEKAEFDAMVAKVKAQLRAFQGRDEDEEGSSGAESEATESDVDPEVVAEQDGLSEPEVPKHTPDTHPQ
ncbi:hypothetical protein V8E53_005539 [Lactarius tabidus]